MVAEHAREVVQIIVETALSPPEVCYFLKLCPAPPPPPKPSGNIPMPSNLSNHAGERAWPSWQGLKGKGTFVQVSDIHIVSASFVHILSLGALMRLLMPVCTQDALYTVGLLTPAL